MRKKTNITKPKTMDEVFDDTSTWGDMVYKPPVLWSILACICTLGTVVIAQSDLGQQQISANFSSAAPMQYARATTNVQPYSVELALLQNELDRTKNEMRTTIAARQSLEQKIATLENKFDDFATGSLNSTNLGDTKPIPPKQMKMNNYKTVEPILADNQSVEISFKDLPKLEPIAIAEAPIAPAVPKTQSPKMELTTASIPEVPQQIAVATPPVQAIKPGAISQNSVPIPPEKPNTTANIQNAHEQLADAKKKLAQDLAKELFKESKSPQDLAAIAKPANDNEFTGSLEPNKKIDMAQPTRSLFAVKLGTEKSMADVNTKWKTTLKNNADVLAGLEPYIHFEEKPKKPMQMNLTVGPFRNTAEATNVCGKLSAAGTNCSVTPFVGQRLLP